MPDIEVTDYHRAIAEILHVALRNAESEKAAQHGNPIDLTNKEFVAVMARVVAKSGIADPADIDARIAKAVEAERHEIRQIVVHEVGWHRSTCEKIIRKIAARSEPDTTQDGSDD